MKIRPSKPEDCQQISEIVSSATEQLRKIYRPKSSGPHKINEFSSIVSLANGSITGYVEYKLTESCLYFQGLAVKLEQRNKGIATQLIQYLAKLAKDKDLKSIELATIEETGNVAVFQNIGFCITSKEITEQFISDAHDSLYKVYMRMKIE